MWCYVLGKFIFKSNFYFGIFNEPIMWLNQNYDTNQGDMAG